jgi:CRISPR-associated Csx2 family protein
VFNDKKVYTRFFPVVASVLVEPDEVLVVQTKQATAKHWDPLLDELDKCGYPTPTQVSIPSGESTHELWEIFNILVGRVNEGDTVVFDITHSFRSLPLISFLSVAYLKFVKNVHIQAIYYGAFDARDKAKNESPVFDLSGFCSLLDWIIGVNSFVKHGSAGEISNLLMEAQKKATQADGPAIRKMNQFGKIIQDVSRALFANRPFEVIDETRKLFNYTGEAKDRLILEQDVQEWAVPFGVLLDSLVDAFSVFAGGAEKTDPANLTKHLEIVRWYVEHNYAPQALSMMRELVISETMFRKCLYKRVFNRDYREK